MRIKLLLSTTTLALGLFLSACGGPEIDANETEQIDTAAWELIEETENSADYKLIDDDEVVNSCTGKRYYRVYPCDWKSTIKSAVNTTCKGVLAGGYARILSYDGTSGCSSGKAQGATYRCCNHGS